MRLFEVARPENCNVEGFEETIVLQAIQTATGASFEGFDKESDVTFVVKWLTKWQTNRIA